MLKGVEEQSTYSGIACPIVKGNIGNGLARIDVQYLDINKKRDTDFTFSHVLSNLFTDNVCTVSVACGEYRNWHEYLQYGPSVTSGYRMQEELSLNTMSAPFSAVTPVRLDS